MVALFEEHPWNNTNHGRPGDSWSTDSYLAMRHDPKGSSALFNLAFVDGHISAKRWDYWGTVTDPAGNVAKVQGVDVLNEMRFPYAYAGNAGGVVNQRAMVHSFPYPTGGGMGGG